MEGNYYEVIAPPLWKDAHPYKEYAYTEQVNIVNGKGTCKSASTAAMLRNLGYTTIFHGKDEATVLVEEEDSEEVRSALEGL